jgi:hypothetical protein
MFQLKFFGASEKNEIKKSREIWSTTRDAAKALFPIQRINCIEKYLLTGLAQSDKNDYLGAFHYVSCENRNAFFLINNNLFSFERFLEI